MHHQAPTTLYSLRSALLSTVWTSRTDHHTTCVPLLEKRVEKPKEVVPSKNNKRNK